MLGIEKFLLVVNFLCAWKQLVVFNADKLAVYTVTDI